MTFSKINKTVDTINENKGIQGIFHDHEDVIHGEVLHKNTL